MSSIFKFKEFDILQKDAVLKVGTDSMLLGAIIDSRISKKGLDLGAGTGVLSLMLAQKNENISIEAIEMDIPTYKECQFNFHESRWSDRLTAIQGNYFEYPFEEKYDLIFSNPPFHIEGAGNAKASNVISKHSSINDFGRLSTLVLKNLSKSGIFWIIVPYFLYEVIVKNKIFKELNINYLCVIHSKPNKLNSRVVIQFSFFNHNTVVDELILRNIDNSYTNEYVGLTKQFHFNQL